MKTFMGVLFWFHMVFSVVLLVTDKVTPAYFALVIGMLILVLENQREIKERLPK